MSKEYRLMSVIYSILQFCFFLFVLLFTAGMNPNRPNVLPIHFWMFAFVISNIFLLFFYNYVFIKKKNMKRPTAVLCIIFLITTLIITLYLLWKIIIEGMDGGILSIIFLISFKIVNLYLIIQIVISKESNH